MDPLQQAKLNGEMERFGKRLEEFMAREKPGDAYLLVHFDATRALRMVTSLDQQDAAAVLKTLLKTVGGDA
jgi:hypothetical protein